MVIDWSGFVPDIIVALLTGVLVGLALFLFETSRRRDETRTQTLAGWLMVAPRLERIVWRPLPLSTADYTALGGTIQRVRDIADGFPLELWQHTLNRDDLRLLFDLMEAHDALQTVAQQTEGQLESALFSKGIVTDIGGMVGIVARAQTIAETDEQLLAMFEGPNEFMRKFISLALSLREYPGYARSEQEYMRARHQVREASVAFVNAVRLARSESFQAGADRDQRRQLRCDYLRHPIRSARRERMHRQVDPDRD